MLILLGITVVIAPHFLLVLFQTACGYFETIVTANLKLSFLDYFIINWLGMYQKVHNGK